jgi:hypothetical protein
VPKLTSILGLWQLISARGSADEYGISGWPEG